MIAADLFIEAEPLASGAADNPALHIAVVAALVLVGATVYYLRRRRRQNAPSRPADQFDAPAGGDGTSVEERER